MAFRNYNKVNSAAYFPMQNRYVPHCAAAAKPASEQRRKRLGLTAGCSCIIEVFSVIFVAIFSVFIVHYLNS